MYGNVIAESKWEIIRLVKFTSSRIAELLSEPKSKEDREAGVLSDMAKSYVYEKIAELITGTTRQVSTASTEWGNCYEPECAGEVKKYFPNMVYLGKETPEFFPYTDFSGGSSDAYDISKSTIPFYVTFEFKCPEAPANFVEYTRLKNGADLKKAEKDYYYQIQMNMACVAKKFGFKFQEMKGMFVAYCPIVDETKYPKIIFVGIEPDMEFYAKIGKQIEKAEQFLADIASDLIDMHDKGIQIPFAPNHKQIGEQSGIIYTDAEFEVVPPFDLDGTKKIEAPPDDRPSLEL